VVAATLAAAVAVIAVVGCSSSEPAPNLVVAESALNANPQITNFVVYGQNSATLRDRTVLSGGDVGVRAKGTGPFLVSGYELALAAGVRVDTTRNLIANRVLLQGARVGDVQTNTLTVQNGGTYAKKYAFPSAMPALPALAPVSPGTAPLAVKGSATLVASPGSYGAVTIGYQGVLQLKGGVYQLASLRLDNEARIEALAPVQVRVAGRFGALDRVWIGAATGVTLTAGDLRIEVAGKNGSSGSLADAPKAVAFGNDATIRAVTLVPNGTLQAGQRTTLAGALLGRDVFVDTDSKVTFESGVAALPCAQLCDDGNPCTKDTCSGQACAHALVAAGTSCSDGNACNGAETCDGAGHCRAGTPPSCSPPDQCHAAGVCDPVTGLCSNLAKPDGTPCDDGNACTTGDVCKLGVCGGTPQTCDDGLACTADSCNPDGTCAHAITTGSCAIDGACYAADATSPANQCQQCEPGSSQTGWTPKSNGSACGDGNGCTCQDGICRGRAGDNNLCCTPTTCQAMGKDCGQISDGCGGTLSCGSCTAPATCGGGGVNNVCGTHLPDPLNVKQPNAFATKEVLLVSDVDWHAVLPLVPAAIWQATTDAEYATCPHAYGGAGHACAVPTLIFHQEAGASCAESPVASCISSDLDATVNFLGRYSPSKISYAGTLPADATALLASKFTLAAAPPVTSYWRSWNTVVYVADNYPLALLAAGLASIENAPLLIKGFNDAVDLSRKNVLCVGLNASVCDSSFTTALDVQRRIVQLVPSDKLLLTAPADLTTPPATSTYPITFEQTQGTLGILFAGYSLAAPFLAAAKLEVLLPYTDANHSYQAIDAFISSQIASIPVPTPAYLTIAAPPNQVPAARDDYCALDRVIPGCTDYTWTQVDGAIYGDLDGDYFQDLAVGRLGGFSVSDVSAYIAGDLFYDRLPASTESLTLQAFSQYPGNAVDTAQFVDRAFSLAGLHGTNLTADDGQEFASDSFSGKRVIYYVGHGNYFGGLNGFETFRLREQRVWFQSSAVATFGCSTCAYDRMLPESQSLLFCDDIIRRGALAYVGAVDDDGSNTIVTRDWLRYLAKGEDLGTAFKHASNQAIADPSYAYSPYNTLLGDPTFAPRFAAVGDVDLAHVVVSQPSAPVAGTVTRTVTVALDAITTKRYQGRYLSDAGFVSIAGPSFTGDSIESSSVGYLKYGPDGSPPSEMFDQTLNLGVAVPNPSNGAFLDVAHAERVVNSQVVDMTDSVVAMHTFDLAGSSYFYIGFQELGPPGLPLVPAQAPYTTPPVTLTVVLRFLQ
jgi:hypothetical protein